MRRSFDILGAAFGLAICALPMLVLGCCILVTMGWPIFFKQLRGGRMGSTFRLIKFRTMSDRIGPTGVLAPDAERITRLGALLRRSRLDELPELWNILRGDMSFVGPRPLLPATIAEFGALGEMRSIVRPGLTGLAQVSGNTLLDNHQKLAMDLLYVRKRTARLDLRILFRTPLVMICGEQINQVLVEKADACRCRRSG